MIIFQHLGKTAGMTVSTFLKNGLGSRFLLIERDCELLNSDPAAFEGRAVVAGHFSTRAINARFKCASIFTCVREPVDRVLSQYFYWRNALPLSVGRSHNGRMRYYTNARADPWADLLECIASDALDVFVELRDYQAWMLGFSSYHRSGMDEATALKRAKEHLDEMLFVGDQRDIGALLGWAAERFDIATDHEFEAVNQTPSRPPKSSIPTSVLNTIRAYNQLDSELYEYARELIARQTTCARSVKIQHQVTEVRDLGPSTAPTRDVRALLRQPDFIATDAWLPKEFPDIAAAMACLYHKADQGEQRLVEFRPDRGGRLVGFGQVLSSVTEVHAVDFRDEDVGYVDKQGKKEQCAANLAQYFPRADVRLWSSSVERQEFMSYWPPQNDIFLALVSAPSSYTDLSEELDFLQVSLAHNGVVVVFDVFNAGIPFVAEGVFSWAPKSSDLIPFLCCRQALWFCRAHMSGLFIDRLVKMLPGADYATVMGRRVLTALVDGDWSLPEAVEADSTARLAYLLSASRPEQILVRGATVLDERILIEVAPHEPEVALYGPYRPLKRGDYMAIFNFDPNYEIVGSCVIDVCCDSATKIRARRELSGKEIVSSNYEVRLDFSIAGYTFDFEVRLFANRFRAALHTIRVVERTN